MMQGAPEIVLARCDTINSPSGAVVDLDDATRAAMLQCFESAASTGMRLLALAECVEAVGLARWHFLGVRVCVFAWCVCVWCVLVCVLRVQRCWCFELAASTGMRLLKPAEWHFLAVRVCVHASFSLPFCVFCSYGTEI